MKYLGAAFYFSLIIIAFVVGLLSSQNEKAEATPNAWVYANGINKANTLCKDFGGILRIGSEYIKGGINYHLMCMDGKKLSFEEVYIEE